MISGTYLRCRVQNHSGLAGGEGATLEGLWWLGSAGCRSLRESDTTGWVLCSGLILSPLISLLWKSQQRHGSLETAVLHSALLTAIPPVFQWVGILINSIHARTFPGEKAHTQHFPGAAASYLDAESLWFHLQKLLAFIITLLCAGCVLKSWLLWWTQPMTGSRKGQFRYKTSRKSSCGAWSSLCQLFLAQAVQQGWHRLLSTGKEHFQQQHWAGQWWALCDCDQPAWAKGSLLVTIPKSGAFRPHPAPGSVSKDTEGGHLLLAGYLVWLWWVVSPLHHLLSHSDCLQIVQNCTIS